MVPIQTMPVHILVDAKWDFVIVVHFYFSFPLGDML